MRVGDNDTVFPLEVELDLLTLQPEKKVIEDLEQQQEKQEEEKKEKKGGEEEDKTVHPQQTRWDRLYEEGIRREAKRLETCEKTAAERVARALFDQQAFSTVGNNTTNNRMWTNNFTERQQKWLQEKEDRLRQLREVAEFAELRRLHPPIINETSLQMTEKTGYEGPIRGWSTHVAKYALRTNTSPPIPSHMFRPNVNLNAHRLKETSENVSDRLYFENIKRQKRLEELIIKYKQNELIDQRTGKPFFKPQFPWKEEEEEEENDGEEGGENNNNNNRSIAKTTEMLYLKALEQREKYKSLIKQSYDKYVFSPQISKRTRKIAERRKLREEKEGTQKNKEEKNINLKMLTFPKKHTKINLEEFLLREEMTLTRRQQKLEKIERLLHEKEQKECTFNPRISKRSVMIFENSQQRYSSISPRINTVHIDNNNNNNNNHNEEQTPLKEDMKLMEKEFIKGQVVSSFSYENKNISTDISNDEGSKLIVEFEYKMKELLDEWRSLESS